MPVPAIAAAGIAQAAIAGVGMVAGFFQSRRARSKERAKRRREKAFALKTQTSLMGAAGEIRSEWQQRGEYAREGLGIQRQSLMNQWSADKNRAIGEVGRTNLSYGGGVEMAAKAVEKDYQLKGMGMESDYRKQFFNIQMGAQAQLRDVSAGLLDLERVAMERGYKVPTQTVNTQANLGGYQ